MTEKSDAYHEYVAVIRAINVGGHLTIKMTDLKGILILWSAKCFYLCAVGGHRFPNEQRKPRRSIKGTFEKTRQALGHQTDVFVMSRKTLEGAVANNPFKESATDKSMRVHLMFLSAKPSADAVGELMATQGEEYHFFVHDKILYYTYSREYDGRRRNIDFERILGVVGTSRTWKVVNKLIELLAEPSKVYSAEG